MGKNVHWQNHRAASIGKRRANAAAAADRAAAGAEIRVDPNRRIDLNEVAFSYDDLDSETRIVAQQRASEIKERIRATAENVVAVGEKLADVQARLANYHGGMFVSWIRAEFGWGKSTAYNFIAVYRKFGSFPNFGKLDIAVSALYQLSAPSTPSDIFEEILERAEQGEVITLTDVKTALTAGGSTPPDDDEDTVVGDDPLPLDDEEDTQPTPVPPPMPPFPSPAPVPPHGLEIGRSWLTAPDGATVKVVGIGGGSVFLMRADGSGGTHKPLEEVVTWQKTDAPDMPQPRPFVTGLPAAAPAPAPASVRGTCPRCGDVTLFHQAEGALFECQTCLEADIEQAAIVPLGNTHARSAQHIEAGNSAFCATCGTLHTRWTAMQEDGIPVWMCARCGGFTLDAIMLLAGVSSAVAAPPKSVSRAMTSSSSDEWYTPEDVIERVRACLGGAIMLDPASCAEANRVVRAKQFLDKEANGLTVPWRVWTVFLNPPYGDEIADWIAYLVEQHREAAFSQALTLIPARTDTAWYRFLRDYPRVFLHGRLSFWNASSPKNAAPFPSVIVGLGVKPKALQDHFGDIGDVFVPYK